jgi:hypothetical protein
MTAPSPVVATSAAGVGTGMGMGLCGARSPTQDENAAPSQDGAVLLLAMMSRTLAYRRLTLAPLGLVDRGVYRFRAYEQEEVRPIAPSFVPCPLIPRRNLRIRLELLLSRA